MQMALFCDGYPTACNILRKPESYKFLNPCKDGCSPICCSSDKLESRLIKALEPDSGIFRVGLKLLYKSY